MPPRKPAPNMPPTRRTTTRKRSHTRKPTNRDGHVKAHTRRTKHGTVHVGAHDRNTRQAHWTVAGNAWAAAAATGVLAIGLLFQLSFTLIAAAAIVVVVTVKVLVYLLTGEDFGRPRRRAAGRHARQRWTKRRSSR